ncbi:hypothetical protein D6D27_10224, partial [Aureobasidium pullulans]
MSTSAKDEVMRKIERAEKGSYSGSNVQSCKKQMSLLERYWIPHLNNEQRVLVHSDLSANNIIMDQHSNLKSVYDFANLDSILDLGWAEMVPLQFATACKKTDLSFGNVFERGLSMRVDSVKFITTFYAEMTRLTATGESWRFLKRTSTWRWSRATGILNLQ